MCIFESLLWPLGGEQMKEDKNGSREVIGEIILAVELDVILARTRDTVVELMRSNQKVQISYTMSSPSQRFGCWLLGVQKGEQSRVIHIQIFLISNIELSECPLLYLLGKEVYDGGSGYYLDIVLKNPLLVKFETEDKKTRCLENS